MSIYRDPQGRCWVFEFDRYIAGARKRTRCRLPRAWSRAQAEAFDRRESDRLYGIATGEKQAFSIEQAVACYLTERCPALKHGKRQAQELDLLSAYFAGRGLSELPDVCSRYTARNKHLAPATVRNRLRYLTAACRWAWKRHGMGESDPAARVVMPSVKNERQIYIDRAQMLKLCRACDQWETRAMIRVAFYSGMRYSEIVRAEISNGTFLLRDTKNGEPRIVPIHPKVRNLLGYVWPEHETMSYWFRKARIKAGMPWLHFHDLRHSSASAMLNAGVHLATVGAVLGHKSPASMKRYAHHSTGLIRDALNTIGRKLG